MHPGWDEFLEKVKLQLAETFLQEKDEKKQKEKTFRLIHQVTCTAECRGAKRNKILSEEYMRNTCITCEKIQFRLLNL